MITEYFRKSSLTDIFNCTDIFVVFVGACILNSHTAQHPPVYTLTAAGVDL